MPFSAGSGRPARCIRCSRALLPRHRPPLISPRTTRRRASFTLDMGGTSADLAFHRRRLSARDHRGEISRRRSTFRARMDCDLGRRRLDRAGSTAGLSHVGPQSAGADPAQRAMGARRPPTVTDADIVSAISNPTISRGGADARCGAARAAAQSARRRSRSRWTCSRRRPHPAACVDHAHGRRSARVRRQARRLDLSLHALPFGGAGACMRSGRSRAASAAFCAGTGRRRGLRRLGPPLHRRSCTTTSARSCGHSMHVTADHAESIFQGLEARRARSLRPRACCRCLRNMTIADGAVPRESRLRYTGRAMSWRTGPSTACSGIATVRHQWRARRVRAFDERHAQYPWYAPRSAVEVGELSRARGRVTGCPEIRRPRRGANGQGGGPARGPGVAKGKRRIHFGATLYQGRGRSNSRQARLWCDDRSCDRRAVRCHDVIRKAERV